MKITLSLATLLFQAQILLAAPSAPFTTTDSDPTFPTSGDTSAAPNSWRLDCGSPGTTAMCSAQNSGAYCDPITGAMSTKLSGSCSNCKCKQGDDCNSRCSSGR